MQKLSREYTATPYAWIILVVLFTGLLATFGMRSSFGAYISPWEQDFSVGRTLITSVSMLSFVVFAIGQPLAGKLNDRLGKSIVPSVSVILVGTSLFLTSRATQMWQVFFTYGIGFSCGISGCCNSVSASILTNWFVEKRGFALGLATSGMAVGSFILVPANLFIIERLGWRTSMAALGIIIVAVVGPLYMFLLRSKPEEKGMKPYGYKESETAGRSGAAGKPKPEKDLPILSVFKTKAFRRLSAAYFVCGFTDVGLIQTHLIPIAQHKNFPVTGVAMAFSLIAIANIVGTIVTGHMSDHFDRTKQLSVIYAFRAVTFIFLITMQSPVLLWVFAVAYGAVEMASIAPTNSLAVELLDGYSTGTLLGIVFVSHQIGGAVGSWAPGLLYDITGSYYAVLALSVIMLFGASLLVLKIPDSKNKQRLA
ncbi:MAG: MFS transporter [Oscillospiraceae bacterium]|nr:MFS transporter [Oscillospiraceae bacterium]